MAAPATTLKVGWGFRDAKGQTSRVRALVGGATVGAIITAQQAANALFAAVSNASVYTTNQGTDAHAYGTNAEFPSVEDKLVLVFRNPQGTLHRFQIPAPKLATFATDGETVASGNADVDALTAWFSANTYGQANDVSPLAYVGGIRLRRRFIRRFNIFTLNPSLTGEGE